ncbi:uncharacterized protein LY89DRAFT_776708 [Mollisia scopiformis]|uniref:Uncharacterized protein n=1 Tax=Mollisia scopiformis TaxID=149040 RepID=A0A194XX31_MOLSC|nr:uncharacterized protein LY89DRAFT_776708 [Mollisia scopiformis]KUJ24634.1 hypothetical protein LY89DRAFT_776708 [Mollisia scopiformis]
MYHGEQMNKIYGGFVANLIKQMPVLQSFRWRDIAFQDIFETALILRNNRLLTSLKDCKTLKHLFLQFGSQYIADGMGADNCWTKLRGFRNLTSLELYHFFGDETRLIRDIVILLSDSPHLKCLGLGKAHDADCDGTPEVIITDGKYRFFKKLCKRYASRQKKNTPPLNLETLKLGHGMFLKPSGTRDTGNYLAKLVKLDKLKVLHLFNSLLLEHEDSDIEETVIDWSLFADCHSIRQLSVSRFTTDVIDWLRGGGNTVQELLVADHYSMYDTDLHHFSLLNLAGLSMLYVREVFVKKMGEEDEWEDIDSDTDAFGSDDDEDMSVDVEPSEEKSEIVDKSKMTVLDRLPDGGTQLSRLALSLEFEDQWARFSTHLPKLKLLTELRIDPKSARGGRYPRETASLWAGVERDVDIAKRYVQLARSLCPSLQYAQIRDWAWQITVPPTVVLGEGEDIYHQIELRELGFDEKTSIELFSYHNFTNQSGLLGLDDYHEPLSEEESRKMDLQMEEIDAALREGRAVRRLFGEGPDIPLPIFD